MIGPLAGSNRLAIALKFAPKHIRMARTAQRRVRHPRARAL